VQTSICAIILIIVTTVNDFMLLPLMVGWLICHLDYWKLWMNLHEILLRVGPWEFGLVIH